MTRQPPGTGSRTRKAPVRSRSGKEPPGYRLRARHQSQNRIPPSVPIGTDDLVSPKRYPYCHEPAAIQSGGDIDETTYELTGLTRGVMYHVWLKAKNEFGVSDFGPVASSNEGEWTLFWVSFSKKQISFRKNYDGMTGGHLLNSNYKAVYKLIHWGAKSQIIVETLDPKWIDADYFVVGQAVRLRNGNDYKIYSNAVIIEE